ncbi:unnamed protein product [Ascophyllum nodosum]
MWNSHGRSLITRTGPEAAAAITTRYQDQTRSGSNNGSEEELTQHISASEVAEASSMIFRRSPAAPSDYVFSPSDAVPSEQRGGHLYPRLIPNQSLRGEVLAMGNRLAADPTVQTAILNDLVRHSRRVPQGRRNINPSLQSPPGDERGLARLVDMLDSEEEAPNASERSRGTSGNRGSVHPPIRRDRRGFFDYDSEGPLQHLHLEPQVSDDWRVAYTPAQDGDWQPWIEEETKDNASESDLSGSRLSDRQLGCSCRKCHNSKEDISLDEVASEGTCWKEILAEYECDICFEVLVGVHVLDNCGHHFCGACMERWIGNTSQGECPVCRTPVDKLVPVRKMDEMIAKAVATAAPSSERTAWYERKNHWESTVRRRQESAGRARMSRAASIPHAQAAAAAVGLPGVSRRQGAAGFRGTVGENGGNQDTNRDDEDREERRQDGFRLTKVQVVLAVAVMLVLAVLKIRGVRR